MAPSSVRKSKKIQDTSESEADVTALNTPSNANSSSRMDTDGEGSDSSEVTAPTSVTSSARRPARSAAKLSAAKQAAQRRAVEKAFEDLESDDPTLHVITPGSRSSSSLKIKSGTVSPSKGKGRALIIQDTSSEDDQDAFVVPDIEDESSSVAVDEDEDEGESQHSDSSAISIVVKKPSKAKATAKSLAKSAVKNFDAIKKGKGKARATTSDEEADVKAEESDVDMTMEHFADSMVKKPKKKPVKKAAEGSKNKKAKKEESNAESGTEYGSNASEEEETAEESGASDDDDVPLSKKAGSSKLTSTPSGKGKKGKGEKKSKKKTGVLWPDETAKEKAARVAKEKAFKAARNGRLSQYEKNQLVLERLHPHLVNVWGDLESEVSIIKPKQAEQPTNIKLSMLPFQLEGLHWMRQQEAGPWSGGMLADEMGMGKTLQTIALIMSDHDPDTKKMTLIVAPTVAIVQWSNEFEKFTEGLNVLVWHGQKRITNVKDLKKYDVVLTSYNVLESTFRRQVKGYTKNKEHFKEDSPMHKIKWHRIILDEAHNIKDRACNTAKASFALKGTYRWCLSGTPLQNRVGELYSLIRFLGVVPFAANFCKRCPCTSLHWKFSNKKYCDDCGHTPMHHSWFWNNEILKPIQKFGHAGTGAGAFQKLKILLDRMMLRRTKVERADDMELPPRTVMVRRDYFTEEEEELYNSLFSDVRRNFETYLDQGTVLNNYANIFTLITRMRQMACHPDLVLKSKTAKSAKAILDQTGDLDEMQICRICLDEAEDAIMSGCRHIYCRECVRPLVEGHGATEAAAECVVCHLPLSINLEAPALEASEAKKARQGLLEFIDPSKWRSSTKIEALVEELAKLRSEDHTAKALVFAQSTTFLDLIARRLQLSGFKYARLQGSMTPEARDRTVKFFSNNVEVTVFLLSLRAGGVALNLTEANHVFICDPWWNPSVEVQAMDRIHRIGQRRPVNVKRLIVENSIESKILELQRKKESMIGAAFGDSDAIARLTPEDFGFLFSS